MIAKLIEEIKKKDAPVVVGLDPQLKFLPQHLLEDAMRHHAETMYGDDELAGVAEAVFRFNKEIVDAVADLVPAVLPCTSSSASPGWQPTGGRSGTARRRAFL